jgi:hypothetical protein
VELAGRKIGNTFYRTRDGLFICFFAAYLSFYLLHPVEVLFEFIPFTDAFLKVFVRCCSITVHQQQQRFCGPLLRTHDDKGRMITPTRIHKEGFRGGDERQKKQMDVVLGLHGVVSIVWHTCIIK